MDLSNFWNDYRAIFPSRYIENGYFDERISQFISEFEYISVLDVGGGTTGTEALKKPNVVVDLLDPFVNIKPEWMNKKIDWDYSNKYDLIVCRGSVNYLTIEEFICIQDMLDPGGSFLFNTFLDQPSEEWSERPYVTIDGNSGIERSRFNRSNSTIEHELEYDGGVLPHIINYYSEDQYKTIFPGIFIEKYKKNSAICLYLKV